MTGAILAGGKSRRMGANKAFIEIEGKPIIERVLGVMREVFDKRLIIADEVNLFKDYGETALPDFYTGAGSLGGIYTALLNSDSDITFVTACDMPDINTEAVKRLVSTPSGGALAIVPLIGGRLHPMHALYGTWCLEPIEEMIKKGELRIQDLFKRIEIKTMTEDDFPGIDIAASVANINTRDELSRRWAKKKDR